MRKLMLLASVIGLLLVRCSQTNSNNKIVDNDLTKQAVGNNDNAESRNGTKRRVYSKRWNGKPLIVKQKDSHSNYKTINEITDVDVVEKLIKILKNATREVNVDVDIDAEDYNFI